MENSSVNVNSASLSIMGLLKEAWRLVHGMKWKIFLLNVLFIAAMVFVNFIFGLAFGDVFTPAVISVTEEGAKAAPHLNMAELMTPTGYLFLFVELLVSWFAVSVTVMLGVKQAVGIPPKLRDTFAQCVHCGSRYFGLMAVFIFASLVSFSIISSFDAIELLNFNGSFCALLLAKILVWFVGISLLVFALPLIVTKNISLMSAIAVGFKAMFQHWFKILVTFVVMYIILFVSALPLGIGMIWTIPMLAMLQGVIFREVISNAS